MSEKESWQRAAEWRRDREAVDLWRFALEERDGDRELLSEDESRRAERLLVASKRRQLVSSRAALRQILGRYLGRSPESLELVYGEHGRPAVRGGDELDFNLSHSGEVALLGVLHSGIVGVDVELCRSGRRFDALARRFFSAAEYEEWSRLDAQERESAFYRTWCRKEAYLKAWGTGLSFPSRRFTVAIDPELRPWLRTTEMPGDRPLGWQIRDLEPVPGYRAALCWRGAASSVRRFALR